MAFLRIYGNKRRSEQIRQTQTIGNLNPLSSI